MQQHGKPHRQRNNPANHRTQQLPSQGTCHPAAWPGPRNWQYRPSGLGCPLPQPPWCQATSWQPRQLIYRRAALGHTSMAAAAEAAAMSHSQLHPTACQVHQVNAVCSLSRPVSNPPMVSRCRYIQQQLILLHSIGCPTLNPARHKWPTSSSLPPSSPHTPQ